MEPDPHTPLVGSEHVVSMPPTATARMSGPLRLFRSHCDAKFGPEGLSWSRRG